MAQNDNGLSEFNRLRRNLRIASAGLVIVTMVGVVGFAIIGGEEHGLVDAIYMTVIALSTVGFGEIIDMQGNPAARVFTIVLLLFGMAIVLYAVPMLAAFVIEGSLQNLFARNRMEKKIAAMEGHYIIGGDTVVADYVTEELVRTGRDVVRISSEDIGGQEGAPDVPTVEGDPSHDDDLKKAGILRARGVVLAMDLEKDNILGVFTARRLAPDARIVAAGESGETVSKLKAAGADAVVSPNRIGGLRLASEMVRPVVVSFLDSMLRDPSQSLRVEEIEIRSSSSVVGSNIESLRLEELDGVVLLALNDPATETFSFKPSTDTRLEPGAKLVVMTDAEGRDRLREKVG